MKLCQYLGPNLITQIDNLRKKELDLLKENKKLREKLSRLSENPDPLNLLGIFDEFSCNLE